MKRFLFFLSILFIFPAFAHAQIVSVGPDAKVQLFDDNGDPLAGGKVCTYLTGTNTATPTYTDYVGNVQNTNPVTLDIAGRANIWWDTAITYRVTVRTGGTAHSCADGTVIYSVDGYKPAGGAGGLLTSDNHWTGMNCWKNKTPWRDVICYGATGDSVTDDGPAIQLAVNDICQNNTNGGGELRFGSPSVNYFIATTVDLKACSQIHLIGAQGDQSGGISQFARAPRIRVQGTAVPLFSFDNTLVGGCDCYVSFENLDLSALNGTGIMIKDLAFFRFINSGCGYNHDAGDPLSACISMQGSTLWFTARDSNFTTANENMGPFNPTPPKTYDPTSWPPAAVGVFGNSTHDGSILFLFDNVTWAFGGLKFTVLDPTDNMDHCGQTFGSITMIQNVIEGQFSDPLLQFENAQSARCVNQSASLQRVTMIESSQSDVAHPTPLISVKGTATHPASLSDITLDHTQSHMSCNVLGINGSENISGIWIMTPLNVAYTCDATGVPGTAFQMVRNTHAGTDHFSAPEGTAGYPAAQNDTGILRGFVPDGTHSDTLTASIMIDSDGKTYYGPGGTSGFDIAHGRTGSEAWGISTNVPPPTAPMISGGAGGSFPEGTAFFFCIAAGDAAFTPFAASVCSSEVTHTFSAGNDIAQLTWTDSPKNNTGKYTIYYGTAAGMENKATVCTCSAGVNISAPSSSNLSPNAIGTLLAPAFTLDSSTDALTGGVKFYTIDGFGNGAPAQPVTTSLTGTGSGPAAPQTITNYLKVNIGGTDFWIPLTQ